MERGARRNPTTPLKDSKPTVFIQAVMVGSTEYYPLSRRIAWHERNQLYARILAIIFPLLTLYFGYTMRAERRKLRSAD